MRDSIEPRAGDAVKRAGDRVVIVTGGARGIGRVYCRALVAAGWNVVVADVLDAEPVADELGDAAVALHADVSDPQSVAQLAETAAARFGGIDALVNNAALFGDMTRGPFGEITVEEWDRMFAVNVRGAWLCARAVVPYMRGRGGGRIVNIGSSTVSVGLPDMLHYVASKAALVGLTRSLARALGDDGIAVNLLVPDRIPHDGIPSMGDEYEDAIARGRSFKRRMEPDDLVGPLLYLLGDGSEFMTGQVLVVDGGRSFSSQ
jgi:NAD(P)-dependent dehydrogenase (short-subunit alcohol dehydrogenase family)